MLLQPGEARCNVGVAGDDRGLQVVRSLPRQKGRHFESFRRACQRGFEGFLRGNRDLRREHQVPGRWQVDRREALADAFAKRVAPVDEDRDVGAQPGSHFAQLAVCELQIPEPVEDQQDGGGIGGAAAQTAADRQVLLQGKLAAFGRAAFGFEQPRRTHAQIFVPKHSREADVAVLARCDAHPVIAVDQAKDGLQLVVAVGAPPEDVEEEIELSRRGIPGQFHCEIASRTSAAPLVSRSRVGRFCASYSWYSTFQPRPSSAGEGLPCTVWARPSIGRRKPSTRSVSSSESAARYSRGSAVLSSTASPWRTICATPWPVGVLISSSSPPCACRQVRLPVKDSLPERAAMRPASENSSGPSGGLIST